MADIHAYVSTFAQAYAEATLWANTSALDPETGDIVDTVDPYDWNAPERLWAVHAFDDESQALIWEDCSSFVASNWRDLRTLDPAQCGHDFALTRNRHGVGFWDRGLGEVGERLTEACRPYGAVDGWLDPDGTEVHLG